MTPVKPVPETNFEWVLLAICIASIWIGFMAIVSWYSGFRSFGRIFTRYPRIRGRKFRFVSIYSGTGPVSILYPLCFSLTIGEDGIYLEPAFFLRPFHHSMRIGWRSVIDCESSFLRTKLRFVELAVSMTVLGRAGRELHQELRRYADKN